MQVHTGHILAAPVWRWPHVQGFEGTSRMARSTAKTLAAAAANKVTSSVSDDSTSESPTNKSSAKKKAPAKKSRAKVQAKKAPAAGKSSTKKSSPAKSAKESSSAKKSGQVEAKALAVKAGEKPWTKAELAQVRGELNADAKRLRAEVDAADEELAGLMRDAGDGAGNDQADVGSTTFERDHEMSLANNAREMLAQTERALGRIDDGSYGICESCGEPIGKMRVMAFPRATLCLSCKQREERR